MGVSWYFDMPTDLIEVRGPSGVRQPGELRSGTRPAASWRLDPGWRLVFTGAQDAAPIGRSVAMEDVRVDGNRRIDRVLGEGYLDDLSRRDLTEIRTLRDEADQEEADLSYLRRLLQARLDLVANEMERRALGEPIHDDIVAHLTTVLTDEPRHRLNAHGSGRHRTAEPSNSGEHRRYVEQLVSNGLLTDLPAASDDDLQAALDELRREEASVSERRNAVQHVSDALGHEIGRRYRDGEADVSTLLESKSDPPADRPKPYP
jgi:hypothetical protein